MAARHSRTPAAPGARHVRDVVPAAESPVGLAGPPQVSGLVAPPTLSLVISRRARRQAAAAASAASTVDPRVVVIERVLLGFQIAGNAVAFALSAAGWMWIATHHPTGQVPDAAANAAQSAGPPLLHPLANVSGTALVLVMLSTCLLMAPSVNPFYVPAEDRRRLHTGRTVAFAVLAVSTVAVLTAAASSP